MWILCGGRVLRTKAYVQDVNVGRVVDAVTTPFNEVNLE